MRVPSLKSLFTVTGPLLLGLNAFQDACRILDYIWRVQTVVSVYPLAVTLIMNPFIGYVALIAGLIFVYLPSSQKDLEGSRDPAEDRSLPRQMLSGLNLRQVSSYWPQRFHA